MAHTATNTDLRTELSAFLSSEVFLLHRLLKKGTLALLNLGMHNAKFLHTKLCGLSNLFACHTKNNIHMTYINSSWGKKKNLWRFFKLQVTNNHPIMRCFMNLKNQQNILTELKNNVAFCWCNLPKLK